VRIRGKRDRQALRRQELGVGVQLADRLVEAVRRDLERDARERRVVDPALGTYASRSYAQRSLSYG
jgi:hypothetical protein